ncbi:MAG: type II secretion system protein M [Sphingomonadales bacterium]
MMDQARDWWMGRDQRERWLLGIMFVLIGFVLLWLLIIRPINSMHETAQIRLNAATLDAGRIAAAAEGITRARKTAPPALGMSLPTAVGQAAEANGFTLSRLDGQGGDRATIAISSARAPALFTWLRALEQQGIIVDKLTLRTNSDATLAVEGVVRMRGR